MNDVRPATWHTKDTFVMDIYLCDEHMRRLHEIRPKMIDEWEPATGGRCWACMYGEAK